MTKYTDKKSKLEKSKLSKFKNKTIFPRPQRRFRPNEIIESQEEMAANRSGKIDIDIDIELNKELEETLKHISDSEIKISKDLKDIKILDKEIENILRSL